MGSITPARVFMHTAPQLSWTKIHYILLALIILFTCAAQVYLFKQEFYSISADESARILEAAEMPFSRILRPTYFPPLYALINKLGLSLYYDLFLAPRILTSIVGVAASMALMFLAYRLFRNSTISIITGFLAVCFPHRLVFSVAPLSEIYFMCFMTLGCAFFLGWITDERKEDLLFSTICFLLCSALRYEGWLACATMACILTVQRFTTKKPDRGAYLISISILLSFPLYWFLSAYFTKRMWAFSSISKYYIDSHGKDPVDVWQRSFMYQFIEQSVFSPLIAGLVSFAYHAVQDRSVRLVSLLLILPILGMTALGFATYALPVHNWWRVAGPALFLLLPFLAHLIYKACSAISINRHVYYMSLVIVTSLVAAWFYAETGRRTKQSNFTGDHLRAGTFLKGSALKAKDKILIDTSTWMYTNVIVASNMPDRFIMNTGPDPLYPKPAVIEFKQGIDVALLKKMHIKYLMFQTKEGPGINKLEFLAKVKAQAAVLNESKALQKINQIGEWGIFAVK
jgi:hypothetical protein